MLTERQVEFIEQVSGGALFGVVMGAVCGLLVAGAILIMQGRRASGIEGLVGPLLGLVPGAAAGAIAAVILKIVIESVEATYCERGAKGGYVIADWLGSLVLLVFFSISLLAAGIAARLAIPDVGTRQRSWSEVRRSAVAWSAIGALVGALAGVGQGFDGYFVVQSNARPIFCAIEGAVFLAVGSLLWQLTVGLTLAGSHCAGQTHADECRSTQPRVRTPMAFVAWSAFLFVVGISTLGTIGAALVLGTALWVGTMVVGRLNVRLAWLFFVIFFAVQPLLLGVSQASWWLSVSNSNSFPRLDTLREAIHLLSLAVCGPLVWIVVRMRLIEFNPLLHILLLPSAALFQGCVLWFIGDRFLRKHDTARRRRLAVLILAVLLLFGFTFVAHYHLL